MIRIATKLTFGLCAAWAIAGAATPETTPKDAPEAKAADVSSPGAIIQAVYSVLSSPLGAPRDWPRLRSLMAPGAIFDVTGVGKDGALRTRVLSVEEFISRSSETLAGEAFYEHGVMGEVWRYAHIATVSSPYESRHAPQEAPFQRGINVFQLAFDGRRWRIVAISWEGETPAFPLPQADQERLKAK
jgi:hypothetical protein